MFSLIMAAINGNGSTFVKVGHAGAVPLLPDRDSLVDTTLAALGINKGANPGTWPISSHGASNKSPQV